MVTRHARAGAGAGAGASENGDALAQLDLDRNRNNQKLKSRFEHIFRKYEHDFTGIGDEFDIHTDQIVVNNGHLEHMRNEADAGTTASSHFVKTFREKLAHEDESVTSEDDEDDENEDDGSDGSDGSDDESDTVSDGTDAEDMSHAAHATPATGRLKVSENQLLKQHALESSDFMAHQPTPRLPQLFRLLAGAGTAEEPLEVPDDEDTDVKPVPEFNARDSLSSTSEHVSNTVFSSSAAALARSKRPTKSDDTVHALGMTIASQLAKLMGASTKKKSKKRTTLMHGAMDPVWDYPELTQTKRTKRKRSISPEPPRPHSASSPHTSSPEGPSLWAVHDATQPGKRKRRESAAHGVKPSLHRFGNATDSTDGKRCWNCSLTRSPSWRKGPHGQDLCLPCGQYYEHHGRMKGFDSASPPTLDHEGAENLRPENAPQCEPVTALEVSESFQHGHGGYNDGDDDDDDPVIQHKHRSSLDQMPRPPAKAQENESTTPSIPYQANTSRPMVSSEIKRRTIARWTVEEDALLIRLKEHEHLSWDEISPHFPSRNTFAIQKNYSSRLRGAHCPGRKLFHDQLGNNADASETENETGDYDNENLSWSAQQDELLVVLRDDDGLQWVEIADLLPGHDPKAVERRYMFLTESMKKRGVPDSLESKLAKHSHVASSGLSSMPQPDQSSPPIGLSTALSISASMPSSSRRSGNALLRQALGNSHRRTSYLDSVPVRAPLDQDVAVSGSSPASDVTPHNIDDDNDPVDSLDPQRAWSSAAASSQLDMDMQHAQADTISENDVAENVGGHQRTASKGEEKGVAQQNGDRRKSSNSDGRGKRRSASRSVSIDAEPDVREVLIRSRGDEEQPPESTADDDILSLARPPDLSWEEIVGRAFSSTKSKSMPNRELFAWIESKYGYYSTAPPSWKNHVREELRRNDRYEIDTARRRNNVWRIRQDVDDPVDIDPQDHVDVPSGSLHEDNPDMPVPDKDGTVASGSTSSQQTSHSASRHVTFSPVVTVSTPMRVERTKTRGRPKKRSSMPISSLERPAEVLEIADSDPSEASVAPECSQDTHANHSSIAASPCAITPQVAQQPSSINSEPETKPPVESPAEHEPQAEQSLLRKTHARAAGTNNAGQTSSSPMAMNRTKNRASVFQTPKRPDWPPLATTSSQSDPARGHSTRVINHKIMTPNPGSRKRVVETPLRELGDPDEDELAG